MRWQNLTGITPFVLAQNLTDGIYFVSPPLPWKDEEYHQNFLFPALAYMLRLDWEFCPEDPTAFHSKPNLPMLQQSSASQQVL